MKVHFRTFCQGCRYGRRWSRGCLWRFSGGHRYEWEYWIECDGQRLTYRRSFRTFERAQRSAERHWNKLAAVSCIRTAA